MLDLLWTPAECSEIYSSTDTAWKTVFIIGFGENGSDESQKKTKTKKPRHTHIHSNN